ncbi:SAM-dependent methyltransferase [uncultured Microbacterium sp.]|uniref:SAM-dependent methyltransferase n=1 Tax=uncultured Microbacterium sp. TaxID=191216 RepID=A0A1Y5P8U9_9MICO|nr:SAM-dependent methyltransferase [uncultured Microbacterium sp.]SBS75124.1 SAM-dependent methyltransferase [uncultured Microbacterium sp.]
MWPFLYYAGDRLSTAELTAARLDGDLVEIGEAFMPADAVETRELRAGALRALVGDTVAVTRVSAAWVHGAVADPPMRHCVQRRSARRIAAVIDARLDYRDLQLPPPDVMMISGVAVTTPVRTLVDLVRDLVGRPDADPSAVDALCAWQPALVPGAVAWLECSGPVHFKRPALAYLRERITTPQEDVTRYTS